MSKRSRMKKKNRSASIASRAASRAKTSATPGTKSASPGSGLVYGPSLRGSFACFDPHTWSWKTLKDFANVVWAPYSQTWPAQGTMLNGVCYPQVSLDCPTDGNGYSLWPTPTASDGIRCKFSLEILKKTFARKSSEWLSGPAQGNLSEHLAAELDLFLRPEFSEWMMDFPIGWTNIDYAESGMPSCPELSK